MEKVRGEGTYRKSFLVVLIIVLLSSCIFVGTVFAWLTQKIVRETHDTIVIGTVDFEIYSGNTQLTTLKSTADGVVTVSGTGELTIPTNGSDTIRPVALEIRNTGTIDAIMRVTLSIYYKDINNNKVSLVLTSSQPTIDNGIKIQNDGWVNDFKDDITSGYVYYNSKISPYYHTPSTDVNDTPVAGTTQIVTENAVDVVTQILVPTSMIDTTYYITLTVEGVAYKGNIYQELYENETAGTPTDIPVTAYPFGLPDSLPSGWTGYQ